LDKDETMALWEIPSSSNSHGRQGKEGRGFELDGMAEITMFNSLAFCMGKLSRRSQDGH
jgi:hypothetical protein